MQLRDGDAEEVVRQPGLVPGAGFEDADEGLRRVQSVGQFSQRADQKLGDALPGRAEAQLELARRQDAADERVLVLRPAGLPLFVVVLVAARLQHVVHAVQRAQQTLHVGAHAAEGALQPTQTTHDQPPTQLLQHWTRICNKINTRQKIQLFWDIIISINFYQTPTVCKISIYFKKLLSIKKMCVHMSKNNI